MVAITFFVSLAVFFLVLIYFFYHLILQYFHYIPSFRSLQKHFGGAYKYGKTVFFHQLSFDSALLSVTARVHSQALFSSSATEVVITSRNSRSPVEFTVSTEPSGQLSSMEIGEYQKNIKLTAYCTDASFDCNRIVTPDIIDILMQAVSIQSTEKKAPNNLSITVSHNSLAVSKRGIPVNLGQLQLLTECSLGLARKFFSEPLAAEIPDQKNPATYQESEMRTTFILLFGVVIIMAFSAFSFFYQAHYTYSVSDQFSGTVYKKLSLPNKERYIFIPGKVRVTDADFDKIREGCWVEKLKGKKSLKIKEPGQKEEKKENILDLMQN